MNVEIVEFYPFPKKEKSLFIGTIHVYMTDKKIDIRGISVIKKKKKFWFQMPMLRAIDEGKVVFFPVLEFLEANEKKEFFKILMTEGKKYIMENYFPDEFKKVPFKHRVQSRQFNIPKEHFAKKTYNPMGKRP